MNGQSSWYIKGADKVYGPFTSTKLKKLADLGKLKRSTPVGHGANGPWAAAERVKGLFTSPKPSKPAEKTDQDSAVASEEATIADESAVAPPAARRRRLRIICSIALLSLGLVMHVAFCEWSFDRSRLAPALWTIGEEVEFSMGLKTANGLFPRNWHKRQDQKTAEENLARFDKTMKDLGYGKSKIIGPVLRAPSERSLTIAMYGGVLAPVFCISLSVFLFVAALWHV